MNTINVFEGRVNRLKEQYDILSRAKESLDLELVKDDRLDPVLEEIRDLKAVWTALSGVWAQIAEMRDTLWTSIQSRKLRAQLDSLLATTREMPSKMRQYAAFEYVQETLRGCLKANALVADLKSEALRERHWRQLYKVLRVGGQYSPSGMTLGGVWDLDLRRNEGVIKEVIVQAQGEMALEEFFKQVRPLPPYLPYQPHLILVSLRRSRRHGRATPSTSSTTRTRHASSRVGTTSSPSVARTSIHSRR
jgi:dynein heavy chain 1